jgi:hypothetical protein
MVIGTGSVNASDSFEKLEFAIASGAASPIALLFTVIKQLLCQLSSLKCCCYSTNCYKTEPEN